MVYVFLGNEVLIVHFFWKYTEEFKKKLAQSFLRVFWDCTRSIKEGTDPGECCSGAVAVCDLVLEKPPGGTPGWTSLVAMQTSALETCDSFRIGWNCPRNFPPQKVEVVLSAALGLMVFHEESISETNQECKSWWLNVSSGSHKLRLSKSEL